MFLLIFKIYLSSWKNPLGSCENHVISLQVSRGSGRTCLGYSLSIKIPEVPRAPVSRATDVTQVLPRGVLVSSGGAVMGGDGHQGVVLATLPSGHVRGSCRGIQGGLGAGWLRVGSEHLWGGGTGAAAEQGGGSHSPACTLRPAAPRHRAANISSQRGPCLHDACEFARELYGQQVLDVRGPCTACSGQRGAPIRNTEE